MPLLWKKGRISQMVADLQSPKRRGGSMVVQTGFPTSLIDLFVKNRDRMRKQSKKNQSKKNCNKSSDFDPVGRVSDQIVTSSEKGSDDLSILAVPSSGEIENCIAGKDVLAVSEDTDSRVSDAESSGIVAEESPHGISGDLASVFAVVVLALCTTKFAVGITLSAFLLLFLECVGKHFSCLVKPCSNAKSALGYMARRMGYAILVLRSDVIVKDQSEGIVFELVEPGVESDSSIVDIEVMSCGTVCIDEGVSQMSLIECLSMDVEKREKVEVGDHKDDLSDSVCEKSKGRKRLVPKLGAKFIKKLVPKKLRKNSKKDQSGTEAEPKPSTEVCEEGSVVQDDRREELSAEEEESENSSTLSVNLGNKCEKQEADGIVASLIVEKKGTESKENFGYLILFLIALAGLVGGRVLALLLTITWCFMLKLIRCWSGSGNMSFPMKGVPYQFPCRNLESL